MYFDKQGLWFKSSKNQKCFKNYFVKESTSVNPSTTWNFCGKEWHISSTRLLRNGSQKNLHAKAKKNWVEKFKVTNPQGPKKTWVPKSTWVMCFRVQRSISGSWIVDAQDTWPEMNPSLLSLQREREDTLPLETMKKEKSLVKATLVMTQPHWKCFTSRCFKT